MLTPEVQKSELTSCTDHKLRRIRLFLVRNTDSSRLEVSFVAFSPRASSLRSYAAEVYWNWCTIERIHKKAHSTRRTNAITLAELLMVPSVQPVSLELDWPVSLTISSPPSAGLTTSGAVTS